MLKGYFQLLVLGLAAAAGFLLAGCNNDQSIFDRIVYAVQPTPYAKFELFTMDEEGGNARKLITTSFSALNPAFSPNGDLLSILTWDDNHADVYIADKRGNLKNISKTPLFIEKFPKFSPDSQKIAYSAMRSDNTDIYISNIDGTGTKRLTKRMADDSGPIFTPDSKYIYWTAQKKVYGLSEIARMGIDGKGHKQLTRNNVEEGPDSFSPDGKWVAASIATKRHWKLSDWEIDIFSSDGKKRIPITKNDYFDIAAKWQPNGNKIIWEGQPEGEPNIFIAEFPKLKIKNLTKWQGISTDCQWTDDGRILFSSNKDGDYEIFIMNADGKHLKKLTDNDFDDRYPTWRPAR